MARLDGGLPPISPTCWDCARWEAGTPEVPRRCEAFPDGIPDEIWRGDNDHTKPYPGDNGLRFLAPASS